MQQRSPAGIKLGTLWLCDMCCNHSTSEALHILTFMAHLIIKEIIISSLSGSSIPMSVWCHLLCISLSHLSTPPVSPSSYSPFPHLCCTAVQGGRWSRLYAGGETERSSSVSRRSPAGEDIGRLCSTPGSPAFADLLWYTGKGLGGTAGPRRFTWGHTLLK